MKNLKNGLKILLLNRNYFNKRVDTNSIGMLLYLYIYYQGIWDTGIKYNIR